MHKNKKLLEMRILVTGFYGEKNLGDDAFQTAIPLVLGPTHEYTFLHVNEFARALDVNRNYDVLLVGGGDVVLPYFLDKIKGKFTAGPTILFGGGITYPSCIELGHLDGFDRVVLRNTTDLRIAESHLGVKYVNYIPDLVFVLDSVLCEKRLPCLFPFESEIERRNQKTAGFYLIQSIDELKPDNLERQERVLNQIAECIRYVSQTHNVVLIRFNTGGKRNSDDSHICETMMQRCKDLVSEGRLSYDQNDYSTPEKMLRVVGEFDVNVCMRFHSHVFTIIQHVPFVSLSLTRKVRLLLDETGMSDMCSVRLVEDPKTLRPIDLSVEEFCEKFRYVVKHHKKIQNRLQVIHEQRRSLLLSGIYEKVIANTKKRVEPTHKQLQDRVAKETVASIAKTVEETWENQLGFSLTNRNNDDDDNITDTFALASTQSKKRVERKVTAICKNALFSITKQIESQYLWGFVQNMLQNPFKLYEYLYWTWEDFTAASKLASGQKKVYFDYMRQVEGTKFHRSGWPFVTSNLRSLNSQFGVLCDTYVDRTFHWGVDVLANSGVIPYTQSWIGFVHHTPLQQYSEYNVVKMIKNPLFLASLQTCKGLFVLSETLKEWFEKHLRTEYFHERPIPICVLTHPTQIPSCDACFSLDAFKANHDKKLVHVGAWLRDTFALYDIGVLDNADRAIRHAENAKKNHLWRQSVGFIRIRNMKCKLRRCILRGRDMNLYLPPETVCIDDCKTICDAPDSSLNSPISSPSASSCSTDESMCRIHCKICRIDCDQLGKMAWETKLTNKWIEGLREHVESTVHASVDVLERLDNEEYDRLLTENIVFLCLRDASACNTVIECAVRNTPLLVNKIPAVVEALGEDYPFYYNSLAEALLKSRNYKLVQKTHEYLCAMDKKKFDIETFLRNFTESDIYVSL